MQAENNHPPDPGSVRLQAAIAYRNAEEETLELAGFIIIRQEDWIVKRWSDGRIEKLQPLESKNQVP
jgi:hypothetical protein